MKTHTPFPFTINFLNRALLLLFLIGLITSHATSQTNPSLTLRLSVVDTQGSGVPGATVVLNREGISGEITGVTTDDGTVTFVDVKPGSNTVTVKATGFATLEKSVIVGMNLSNDFTLAIEPIPLGPAVASDAERAAMERNVPRDKDNNKCAGDIKCKVRSLELPVPGRFARGFQYEYKLGEQPGTVLISSGQNNGLVTAFVRNPQHYLQQHTITYKFSELFPDRLSLFKRGNDYLNKDPSQYPDGETKLTEYLCGRGKPLITCLTKGGGWFQRFLMGASINVSFPERADVLNGFFVTDPKFGKKYQVNGGFTFDPTKLFPNATNWRTTFEEVQKIDKALALLGASDAIWGRRPWKPSLAAALIPKVEFKRVTQFDFVKNNGILIQAPFPERALNTWTFTWDLTRVIPDTKNRIDEDVITDALMNLGKKEPQRKCILHFAGKEDRTFDVKPAFTDQSCKHLKNLLGADSYEFPPQKEDEPKRP